jgi:hypothetical protein
MDDIVFHFGTKKSQSGAVSFDEVELPQFALAAVKNETVTVALSSGELFGDD